jgi:transcriptional regulator with XRE-family HTH domain
LAKPGRLSGMVEGPFGKLDVALRALRLKKGWTLEEAGRRAKVDPGNLSRYETGALPTLLVLGRILTAYETSVVELAELLAAAGEPTMEGANGEAEAGGVSEDPFVTAVAGALQRLGFKRPGEEGRG